jgi:hypothetical protein
MRFLALCRAGLCALIAVAGATVSSAANADNGSVRISLYTGGWFIGGSGGEGTLLFRGRQYRLSIGGVRAGLIFGGSHAYLQGWVSDIRRPSDIAGIYGAAAGGATIGTAGEQYTVLRNAKGARLHLSGRQVGLMINADLSGMAISLK